MKKRIFIVLIYIILSITLITINSIPIKNEKIEVMIQQEIEEMKLTREEHKLNISDELIEEMVRESYETSNTFWERFINNSRLFFVGLIFAIIWLLWRFLRRKERRDGILYYKKYEE